MVDTEFGKIHIGTIIKLIKDIIMSVSRSALEFLRRRGLVDENLRPTCRLNLTDLLVHTVPIIQPLPTQEIRRSFEGGACGDSPPDRNVTHPWYE